MEEDQQMNLGLGLDIKRIGYQEIYYIQKN